MRKSLVSAALVGLSVTTVLTAFGAAPAGAAPSSSRTADVSYASSIGGGEVAMKVSTTVGVDRARKGRYVYSGAWSQALVPDTSAGMDIVSMRSGAEDVRGGRCSSMAGRCTVVSNDVVVTVRNSVGAVWRETDRVSVEISRRTGKVRAQVSQGFPEFLSRPSASSSTKTISGGAQAYDLVVDGAAYKASVSQSFQVTLNGVSNPAMVPGSYSFDKSGSYGSDISTAAITSSPATATVGDCATLPAGGAKCLFVTTVAHGVAVTKYGNTWMQDGTLITEVNAAGQSMTTLDLGTAVKITNK